jgi:hypothetical protein
MTDIFNLFPRKAAEDNGDSSSPVNNLSHNGLGPGGVWPNPPSSAYTPNGRNGSNGETSRVNVHKAESSRDIPGRNTEQLQERLPGATKPETSKLNPTALPATPPTNPGNHGGQEVLKGSLAAFSPSSLLSLLNIQKQTGWLYLHSNNFEGYIYIDKGEVYDAGVGRISSGALAVFQLFGWKQGEFSFETGAPAPDRRTIEATLPVLQVRATLWLDSMSKYSPVIPSPNHRVAIAAEPRSEVVIEPYQWAVLTKIVSRSLSVAELAAELNQDLMTVTRIAAELVKMGVAVVQSPDS